MKKKFQQMLILVFEVIMQPPKQTFEIGIFFRLLAHCAGLNFEVSYFLPVYIHFQNTNLGLIPLVQALKFNAREI